MGRHKVPAEPAVPGITWTLRGGTYVATATAVRRPPGPGERLADAGPEPLGAEPAAADDVDPVSDDPL